MDHATDSVTSIEVWTAERIGYMLSCYDVWSATPKCGSCNPATVAPTAQGNRP